MFNRWICGRTPLFGPSCRGRLQSEDVTDVGDGIPCLAAPQGAALVSLPEGSSGAAAADHILLKWQSSPRQRA